MPAALIAHAKRQSFRPSARGSLAKIAETPHLVHDLAPESPRPMEMLQGVKVDSDHNLTAFDHGLYEYLQSWAFEHDKDIKQRAYRIPLPTLRRFMGPHTKTADVIVSLAKLSEVKLSYTLASGPRFIGVQMLISWQEILGEDAVIAWQYPEPIRELMGNLGLGKYAHLELVPLTTDGMSSRYSAPLYKWLAFEASQRKWIPGQSNTFDILIEPGRLVAEIDFPQDAESGKYNVGKLTKFVTETFVTDTEKVRRFSVAASPVYDAVRGRKISAYKITVRINPPAMHNVRVRYDKSEFRRGGKDDPKYQVRSDIWLKASKVFSVKGSPMWGMVHWKIFDLWLVALQEALDDKGLTDGFSTRPYRGESLLVAIETEGANYACWGFLSEEVADPDLLDHLQLIPRQDRSYLEDLADYGRRDRVGWKTDRRRKVAKRMHERVYYEKPADVDEPVTFETCIAIHMYFNLPVEELEDRIFVKIRAVRWTGTRAISLTCHYPDEHGHDGIYRIEIKPTFDEWCSLLNKLSIVKKGTEIYA